MVLEGPAFVNQIVTAWYDPCKDTPSAYNLYNENRYTAGVYDPIVLNRATSGDSSCLGIASDNGAASFCIDSFMPRVSQRFRVTFDDADVSVQVDLTLTVLFSETP